MGKVLSHPTGGRVPGDGLYSRVRKYILEQGMICRGESVVAGFSGGADSRCLFEILVRLSGEIGFVLEAVHVHHGLRASADGDLAFVEDICRRARVPCTIVRADASARAEKWGTGVEEAGRRIRYEAFRDAALRLEKERHAPCRIAVAHHREDQAETVLFHLCRGTDLRGAGGMRPLQGRVIRPLLRESRASIEAFLVELGLVWRTDETNADTGYTRNFLRGEILPRLAQGVNPASADRIAQFADTCGEAERFLEEMTRKAMVRCAAPEESMRQAARRSTALEEGLHQAARHCAASEKMEIQKPARSAAPEEAGTPAICIPALLREDPFLQRRILYSCLAEAVGTRRDLCAVHIDALQKLCAGDQDGRLSMPGHVTALRSTGLLFFLRQNGSPCDPPYVSGFCVETTQKRLASQPGLYGSRLSDVPEGEINGRAVVRMPGRADCGADLRLPLSGGEYECHVFPFDGSLSAIPQKKYTKWFDYDKIGAFPVFRTRQPGDRMSLRMPAGSGQGTASDGCAALRPKEGIAPDANAGGGPAGPMDPRDGLAGGMFSKKIARIMLDSGIPAAIRDRIVLPFHGREALWIPGVRMGDRWKVTPGTKYILEISLREEDHQRDLFAADEH